VDILRSGGCEVTRVRSKNRAVAVGPLSTFKTVPTYQTTESNVRFFGEWQCRTKGFLDATGNIIAKHGDCDSMAAAAAAAFKETS